MAAEHDEDMDSIVRDASYWVSLMEDAGALENSQLTAWLFKDPAHVSEYLEMLELERVLYCIDAEGQLAIPDSAVDYRNISADDIAHT